MEEMVVLGDYWDRPLSAGGTQRKGSEMREYQGQLWGGPGHGNIVSAIVERIKYQSWTQMWLDGDEGHPSNVKVNGEYVWNSYDARFDWQGPGADGDTIERLRLR